MAAGLQTAPAQINATCGIIATQLRNLFQQIDWVAAELGVLGETAGLVALGFTQADAAVIVSTMGNLETLSQIYQGKAVGQSLPFNFQSNSQGLWGFETTTPGS